MLQPAPRFPGVFFLGQLVGVRPPVRFPAWSQVFLVSGRTFGARLGLGLG